MQTTIPTVCVALMTIGPGRCDWWRRATPRAVKAAAFAAFGVACVAGLVLAALTTWWLVALGVVCVVAAWTYTGGPRPYGYAGLGEVFVFVFFGLVATAGTTYVIVESVSVLAVLSGVLAGLLAVALLMVNNIRDIDGDSRSGKRTLAVRLGSVRSKNLFVLVYVAAFGVVIAASTKSLGALLGLAGLLAALPAISTVREATTAPRLIAALGMTARTQLVVGACYALGLVIQ
jgi:1,4-dihydroxy-2-naphthoate octaprenyltransferase